MSDIIDAFAVALKLDPAQYNEEIKKYREDRKRLASEDEKYQRREQDGQRKTTDGIRRLRNETVGFLTMLAGANSVKQFVGDLLNADAQTGRFAANIGMATERVGVWEEALKRVGGTSADAQGSLRALATIFQNYQLLGDNSKGGDLAFFGLSERGLQNPEEAMMQLADRVGGATGQRRAEFAVRLQRLGLNDSTITLLFKGRTELEKLLTEVEKTGVATDESAKAAQELDASLAKLSQTIKGQARPYVKEFADTLNEVLKNEDAMNIAMAAGIGILGALGVAATLAAAPFVILAGVIAEAAYVWSLWQRKDSPRYQKLHGQTQIDLDQANGSAGGVWNSSNVHSATGQPVDAATLRMANAGRGGTVGLATGSGGRNAAAVEQFFRGKGYTPAQARGIAAGIVAEGGLNTRTGGGHKGRALGIGQWLGPRRAELLRRYGANFTFEQELEFFHEEMNRGDGKFVAKKIKQTGDSGAIARLMVDDFFRPAAGGETTGDYQRASRYLRQPVGGGGGRSGGSVSTSNTTTIGQVVVYTPASNAEGIARDIRGELAKRDMVVQGTSGLKP